MPQGCACIVMHMAWLGLPGLEQKLDRNVALQVRPRAAWLTWQVSASRLGNAMQSRHCHSHVYTDEPRRPMRYMCPGPKKGLLLVTCCFEKADGGASIWRGSRSSRFASRKRTPDSDRCRLVINGWAGPVQARQDELAQLGLSFEAGNTGGAEARRTDIPVSRSGSLDGEQQFRGWACVLQIAIIARPAAIIDYYVSPWERKH